MKLLRKRRRRQSRDFALDAPIRAYIVGLVLTMKQVSVRRIQASSIYFRLTPQVFRVLRMNQIPTDVGQLGVRGCHGAASEELASVVPVSLAGPTLVHQNTHHWADLGKLQHPTLWHRGQGVRAEHSLLQ